MVSGSEAKYEIMSMDNIKALPVGDIAAKDSVLFLWATVPLLPDALDVMKAWGYKYKTSLFWRKIMSLGMGFWYRGQVELLLMGVKGKVKAFRIQKANFIQFKALRHSEKPEEMRKLIEESHLSPKIELFARRKVEGWDCWGNEVESEIEL